MVEFGMERSAVALAYKRLPVTEKGVSRAKEILEVARKQFAEFGFAGLSMRALANEIGVTLSNLQHYYPSKEALVEATLLSSFDELQLKLDQLLARHAGSTPIERFEAAIDMYIDLAFDRQAANFNSQLWALAISSAPAAVLAKRQMSRSRKTLAGRLQDVSGDTLTQAECEARAATVLTQLIGLYIYFHRSNAKPSDLARLRLLAREHMLAVAVGIPARPF